MIRTMNIVRSSILIFILTNLATISDAQDLTGLWDAKIECPGGGIRFGLELHRETDTWTAHLINGSERIKVPVVKMKQDSVILDIDHYDSTIELTLNSEPADRKRLIGNWRKRRGANEWSDMRCSAEPHRETKNRQSPKNFLGRWAVNFDGSEDPAVGIFKQTADTNQVLGTFLTSTGDYRYLAGEVTDGVLEASCFDGAHAFLFRASLESDGMLHGDFWSSSTWHEKWTANRDQGAKLLDDFKQTKLNETIDYGDLSFPDLEGKLTSLNDPKFHGKVRIIYVFGSWCPNCHDAGEYFSSLEKKYGSQGLSVLGLAFELTGDFDRDAAQVRKYLKRRDSNYPVLVAGLADKAKASKSLPIFDRIRSYPTTIILDGQGNVKAIHTGFTGPATGETFENLKRKFETLIENELGK